jgi:hypothetical protein
MNSNSHIYGQCNTYNNFNLYGSQLSQVNSVETIKKQIFQLISQADEIIDAKFAIQFIKQQDSFLLISAIGAGANNALHFACTRINKANCVVMRDIIATLLTHGLTVNSQNAQNSTPLHLLCELNSIPTEIVTLLLDHGADVNICNQSGDTPLHTLCGNSSILNKDALTIAKYLCEKRINYNNANLAGRTALDLACQTKKYHVARLLMKKGEPVSRGIIEMINRRNTMYKSGTHNRDDENFIEELNAYFNRLIAQTPVPPAYRPFAQPSTVSIRHAIPSISFTTAVMPQGTFRAYTTPPVQEVRSINSTQSTTSTTQASAPIPRPVNPVIVIDLEEEEDSMTVDEESYTPQSLQPVRLSQPYLLKNEEDEEPRQMTALHNSPPTALIYKDEE